jgi:hypothetical protein
VDTGSAEVGFVAPSEVAGRSDGSRWIVPANLYNAIRKNTDTEDNSATFDRTLLVAAHAEPRCRREAADPAGTVWVSSRRQV